MNDTPRAAGDFVSVHMCLFRVGAQKIACYGACLWEPQAWIENKPPMTGITAMKFAWSGPVFSLQHKILLGREHCKGTGCSSGLRGRF